MWTPRPCAAVVLGFLDKHIRSTALGCVRVPRPTAWVALEAPRLARPVPSIEEGVPCFVLDLSPWESF